MLARRRYAINTICEAQSAICTAVGRRANRSSRPLFPELGRLRDFVEGNSDVLLSESMQYRSGAVTHVSAGRFSPARNHADASLLDAQFACMLDDTLAAKLGEKLSAVLRESLKVRPNTALPESFFQANMVVCTGEDPAELTQAMSAVFAGEQPEYHEYRCYRAWKFKRLTVVISGIGTGSLEPLMFELLDQKVLGERVPRRLVLIGTAGYLSDAGFGQVYLVEHAYPLGSAVNLRAENLPLAPSFDDLDRVGLPRADEISTDYYYACTPQSSDARKVAARDLNPIMSAELPAVWQAGRLISMESAQFYHFAQTYGPDGTQYVALRGVANLADQFETQGQYSLQVLTEALRQAAELLR